MKTRMNCRICFCCLLLLLVPFGLAQQISFRITPVRPVEELRAEALEAQPPREQGSFRPADLIELAKLDPTIKLDIRYATTNNFLGTPVYTQARAFLQRPAAEGLLRAHQELKAKGYGRSEFAEPQAAMLSETAALVRGVAVRYAAAGPELERIPISYLMHRTSAGWKIAVLVLAG